MSLSVPELYHPDSMKQVHRFGKPNRGAIAQEQRAKSTIGFSDNEFMLTQLLFVNY